MVYELLYAVHIVCRLGVALVRRNSDSPGDLFLVRFVAWAGCVGGVGRYSAEPGAGFLINPLTPSMYFTNLLAFSFQFILVIMAKQLFSDGK